MISALRLIAPCRSKIVIYDLLKDVRFTLTQDWDRSPDTLAVGDPLILPLHNTDPSSSAKMTVSFISQLVTMQKLRCLSSLCLLRLINLRRTPFWMPSTPHPWRSPTAMLPPVSKRCSTTGSCSRSHPSPPRTMLLSFVTSIARKLLLQKAIPLLLLELNLTGSRILRKKR